MFAGLGFLGLALIVVAIVARTSRPLAWAAVPLCAEELIALEVGDRAASGWAFAFAVLLFAGIESAYWASERVPSPQPLAVYGKSLWPMIVAAVIATGLIALIPRSSAIAGLGLIAVGLGAATALVVILALLALRMRSSSQK